MEKENQKLALLGSAPVHKALLAMGLPTMTGMMINALYNLADAWFVSGLGTTEMGAVSVVFPLGQVAVGLGLLFGSGAASYLSRLLGRGEREAASKTAATALYSALLVGAAAILCMVLLLEPILRLMKVSEGIMPYALVYARIYLLSCIFNVFNVTMNNISAGEGAAKTAMGALLSGAVLNIALDPLCIYTLHLGVAGAAIATAVSQVVSTAVYIVYIRSGKSAVSFHPRHFSPTREILSEILKIGVPTLVFQLLTSLSIILVNRQAAVYGDGAVAAMGAVTRVTSMGSLMVFGFLKGFQAIAGFSYGAKNFPRLRKVIRTALLWSTGFCLLFGLGIVLFAPGIIGQFAKGEAQILSVGVPALRAAGASFPLFGFYTVYSFLLLALGRGGPGFFLGACRQGICFVPVILIFPTLWGITGIFLAQPAADVLSAAAAAVVALRLHRELSD